MRSVSRHIPRVALLAICGLLMVGGISGCTTTQETAEKKQAESKRFLEQREKQRAKNKHEKKRGGEEQ